MDNNNIQINAQVNIPLSELEFRFSGSRGPGGQHVNKTATKVTLLFDVLNSPSLDDDTRNRLLKTLGNYVNKEGVLQIQEQGSRSQHRNRETAVRDFQQLLADALKPRKKRRKTKIPRAAVKRRLEEKKKHAQKKRDRRQNYGY